MLPKMSPPAGYRWAPVAGTGKYTLTLDGKKLGVYDPKNNTYREYGGNGELTAAKPLPWDRTKPAAKPAKQTQAPAPVVVKEPAESEEPPNPWMPYAIGGGVTSLFILIGLVARSKG